MDPYTSTQLASAGGYGSEFESDAEEKKRKQNLQNLLPQKKRGTGGVAKKRELEDEYSKEEWKIQRLHILSMDAYARHRKYINDYLLYYGGSQKDFKRDTSRDRTDLDVIRENHRFLWDEEDEDDSWEKNLAKKYYDKLFKEYCIADLSRYKENKIGMRWRVEKEVVDGKGQFVCGNKKCNEREGMRSWEVNFGYMEHGEKKNALVKLRLCPDCSYKLNYRHRKKEVVPKNKNKKGKRSKKKHKSGYSSSSDEDAEEEESASVPAAGDTVKDAQKKAESENTSWQGPAKIAEEKSREEEFEDYFEDMFL
ncbi:protein FRA10AC1 homolog [Haliotis rufescens]|uniref:protein FRA10AC1 homolog n=1 Tax=Haliotis rufescens TaxID=6454 RepID=UPI001EAFCE33|nr:protein FRA10AC1 homolog [Haliotis rufescens]XP_046371548.1 protein FRA10AC1 homolog [Haliotis rufescens]